MEPETAPVPAHPRAVVIADPPKGPLVKSHRTRRTMAGAALALTMALTGCAQADPSAAVRSGDTVVATESDVQTAVAELGRMDFQQAPDAKGVTQLLTLAPILENHLRGAGVGVSDQDVRSALGKPSLSVSDSTMRALRAAVGIRTVQQAGQAAQMGGPSAAQAQKVLAAGEAAMEEFKKKSTDGTLVVNPKYAGGQNNWIEAPQQQADAEQPQQ